MSKDRLLQQIKKFSQKGHITDKEMKILRVKARNNNISEKALQILVKEELGEAKNQQQKFQQESTTTKQNQDSYKFCVACGEQIDKSAKICPQCGGKQPGFKKRKRYTANKQLESNNSNKGWGIAIALILGGILLFAIFNNKNANYSGDKDSVVQDNRTEQNDNANQVGNLSDHLTTNTFTLNGGGSVSFIESYGQGGGRIVISGTRNTLSGEYEVRGKSVKIQDLKVESGRFDASNNSPSYGSLRLQEDGTLEGTIYGGNSSRDIVLEPK